MRILLTVLFMSVFIQGYTCASDQDNPEGLKSVQSQLKKSILVVDDSLIKRLAAESAISRELKKAGIPCEVDKADGPQEAIILASKKIYDGFVLDHDMPEETGPQLAVRLRKLSDEGTTNTTSPFYVLNTTNEEARSHCIDQFDAIPKGSSVADLASAVVKLVLNPSSRKNSCNE